MERKGIQFVDVYKAIFMAVIGYLIVSLSLSFFLSFLSRILAKDVRILADSVAVRHIGAVLNELAFFLIFLYFYKKRDVKGEAQLNGEKKISLKVVLLVIILAVIALLASLNFTLVINHLFSLFALDRGGAVAFNGAIDFLLSTITMCILPAFCEELLFRGVIFSGLKKRFSLVISVVLSSLIFALIHMSIFSFVHQFLLGIILSLLFYYTSNIFYSMTLHFMNNFLVLIIEYIFGDSFPLLISSFSFVYVLLAILIALVGVALVTLIFCNS